MGSRRTKYPAQRRERVHNFPDVVQSSCPHAEENAHWWELVDSDTGPHSVLPEELPTLRMAQCVEGTGSEPSLREGGCQEA